MRTEAEKHAWYLEILAQAEKDQAVPQGFLLLRLFQARSYFLLLTPGGKLFEREWSQRLLWQVKSPAGGMCDQSFSRLSEYPFRLLIR